MKHVILLAAILFAAITVNAQKKATGMIFDPPTLRAIPYKAKLTAQSYKAMPTAASLEKFCPTPGDQGQYGTCVAFSVAYHLRTILWAKQNNITDKSSINQGIFSPSYVYEQIKGETDINCQDGTNPVDAFELLKTLGVATNQTMPYRCGSEVVFEAMLEGFDFRLADYQILYLPDEPDASVRINTVKKALAEGYPCMLGFIVAESFYSSGALWEPQSTDDGPTGQHGRHAMCIVGYDDNQYGGAFRIMNSWGSSWGDGGFVWVKYKDFADYSLIAIQGYPAPKNEPTPEPEPEPAPAPEPAPTPKPTPVNPVIDVVLSGNVTFQTSMGTPMLANRILTRNLIVEDDVPAYQEDLVAYRLDNAYSSGTKFRFYITTNSESYIYAFATDLSGKVNKILPFDDNMSPHIGPNSQVAFPSESKVVKMDNNPGTDYMLILYSQEPLNANQMLEEMNRTTGGLSQKIKAALGDKLILPSNVGYSLNTVGFDVKKNKHAGTVVPLMVEMTHN
jgi:hypothetical protein